MDMSEHTPQVTPQIALHLRQVFFGGNWTYVNLQDTLADVTWEQALQTKPNGHSIVKLTYHIHYFVAAVLPVLNGLPLDAHDQFSFDHPELENERDWKTMMDQVFADAETLAQMIEALPDARLWEHFVDPKYGNYYRNFHGLIEHTHYHLAQIAMIKKELQSPSFE
jgi:hypothetical protein